MQNRCIVLGQIIIKGVEANDLPSVYVWEGWSVSRVLGGGSRLVLGEGGSMNRVLIGPTAGEEGGVGRMLIGLSRTVAEEDIVGVAI